ncbi:MAG TPA: peptide ABC transporter substrate-binding protein [Candidatus Limnocylindrales bacterium]
MNRRDQAILGALVALLLVIAVSIGIPSLSPLTGAASASGSPAASAAPGVYVEGTIGAATEVSPLAARSRIDRDLVALVFSGLVRLGPDQTLLPDLADRWQVDSTGAVWTFHLRPGTVWQDGAPLTSADVVFTIKTLQDPNYSGPGSSSWDEVTVTAPDDRTVAFRLATPLGGFLQAATQPIVPAHLLRDVAVDSLGDDAFNRAPVGSGSYRLTSLDDHGAVLVPSAEGNQGEVPVVTPVAAPTDALAIPSPASIGGFARPYIPMLEFQFFPDAASLSTAYKAGGLDAASGLPPDAAVALSETQGSRLLRYPGTTLLAVVLDLRSTHQEFRDASVRRGLLEAIDRDVIVANDLSGLGTRADGLLPPWSWAYSSASNKPVPFDVTAAEKALAKGGWTSVGGSWKLPGATDATGVELVSADKDTSPVVFSVAESVAQDWRKIGLAVTHVGMAPTDLASSRLRTGNFAAAVIAINIGLDPDLYPYLASTQTLSGGSNVSGLQDPALDRLLAAARAPGNTEARIAAYAALQAKLADSVYLLPIAYRDNTVVARNTLAGPVIRPLGDSSDRFWDVLTWRLASNR